MTEQITDERDSSFATVPYYKVVRMVANPDGERFYAVMQKMTRDGQYAGWRHASKGYSHSTSAYAALGRLVQKYIRDNHPSLPENER